MGRMVISEEIEDLREELEPPTPMDWIKTTIVLVVNAFLFSLSALISSVRFASLTKFGLRVVGQPPDIVFATVFFSILVGGFFVGWIFTLIMDILGGTGTALKGVSAVAYSILPVSIGTLLASTAAYFPPAGPVVAYCLIFLFGAIGYAVLYRTAKEFFDVGMITAFVAVSLLISVGTGAFYASFLASTTDLNVILGFLKP